MSPTRPASRLKAFRVGFRMLPLHTSHIAALTSLEPSYDHKDRFDHMLIAQALVERATLVSQDRRMTHYPVPLIRCR